MLPNYMHKAYALEKIKLSLKESRNVITYFLKVQTVWSDGHHQEARLRSPRRSHRQADHHFLKVLIQKVLQDHKVGAKAILAIYSERLLQDVLALVDFC